MTARLSLAQTEADMAATQVTEKHGPLDGRIRTEDTEVVTEMGNNFISFVIIENCGVVTSLVFSATQIGSWSSFGII